jgi:hypothetical protein
MCETGLPSKDTQLRERSLTRLTSCPVIILSKPPSDTAALASDWCKQSTITSEKTKGCEK